MVNTTCAVLNCKSSSRIDKDLRFHHFPYSETRRLLWIQACRRDDLIGKSQDILKYKTVCSLHFSKSAYAEKNLKKSALPTLDLPATPTFSMSTQTAETSRNLPSLDSNNTNFEEEATSFGDKNTSAKAIQTNHDTSNSLKIVTQYSANKSDDAASDPNDITNEQSLKECAKFLSPRMMEVIMNKVKREPPEEIVISDTEEDNITEKAKSEPIELQEESDTDQNNSSEYSDQDSSSSSDHRDIDNSSNLNQYQPEARKNVDELIPKTMKTISERLEELKATERTYDKFGLQVASLLRDLPRKKALTLQPQIVNVITVAIAEEMFEKTPSKKGRKDRYKK